MILSLAALVLIWSLWQQVRELRGRIELLEQGDFGYVPAPLPLADIAPPAAHEPIAVIDEWVAPPPPPAEPVPEPVAPAEFDHAAIVHEDVPAGSDETRGSRFEEIFGRRLPIWAGGVTLAVAGFLIVKYSVEAGLLSPLVRTLLGLLFGSGLIVGAELALRRAEVVRDPRVRQALAGAGIATLYAVVLAAVNLYALVNPVTAFIGMALVTVLAGGLSLRFGAPSAVLGLIGGLAAPALVGSTAPNVPLLALYLTLAVGGLCALGRQQRWWWLGAAALLGGFGWGAVLILGGALDLADALSVGFFMLALGIALPMLVLGERAAIVRLAGSVMGCAQLAALVATGGFAPLHWGLFGLISIAILWLSRRERLFADVPAFALGVATLLGLAWPAPTRWEIGLLLAAMTAIFALPAALRLWREEWRAIDAPSVAATALAIGVLPAMHFGHADTGATSIIGAVLAAGTAVFGWRVAARREDTRFATLAIAAATLLAMASFQMLVSAAWAPAIALLALGLAILADRAEDRWIERAGWLFGAATILLLLMSEGVACLSGWSAPIGIVGLATWGIPAVAASVNARFGRGIAAQAAQPIAVVLGYGAVAQVAPTAWLPLVPVAAMIALASARRAALLPAIAATALLMAGWACWPLLVWQFQALNSASGGLASVSDWPAPKVAITHLGLPALALFGATFVVPLPRWLCQAARLVSAVMLTIALHIAYKQVFAIQDAAGFIAHAMAERTLWEMLLAACAGVAWWRSAQRIAIALGGASLAHFLWFTALIDNPLFQLQDVGPWAALSYAMAGGLLWWAPRALPRLRRQRDWLLMAVTALGGFTLLRQAFHAPILLAGGTGPGEEIARSVLAIVLAGGFLWIGIIRGARDWRIASLALMLIAVVKVFVFDASGLDGLARIASFAALGFSLIGVGWLYSRYLPDGAR